jgi:hypothetical protein
LKLGSARRGFADITALLSRMRFWIPGANSPEGLRLRPDSGIHPGPGQGNAGGSPYPGGDFYARGAGFDLGGQDPGIFLWAGFCASGRRPGIGPPCTVPPNPAHGR